LLKELPERERFAAMELWRGTMTSHSFIAYAADSTISNSEVSSEDWKSYVPLRLPSTMCVTERLPKGAAGVLLNRSHAFHDLILVIDEKGKAIFDAIDGRRSIADIAGSLEGRTFFEKLWLYDQIVFDTSVVAKR
jgi:hypothetical protein